MKKAWYILNYHDISWEQNSYLGAIGETFPPDIFAEHLAAFSQHFEFVSIQEGWSRLSAGKIDAPLLSFWFDDGYLGVRKYAEPILDAHGVTGGIAVNSDFLLRKNLFWRMKLSHLTTVDGLRFLRSTLRKLGFKTGDSVREFTLQNVDESIISSIDDLYTEFTRDIDRNDAWRLFDDAAGVMELQRKGWDVSNHTVGHFPLKEQPEFLNIQHQFLECETQLQKELGLSTRFWVLPFGRPFYDRDRHQQLFEAQAPADKVMVYGYEMLNKQPELHQRRLFRITPRLRRADAMLSELSKLKAFAG